MKLTPLDIKKQEFTRALRGYDQEEVQAFLDMMARQWEEMTEEHRRLESKVRDAEHKLQHYQQVEMALQSALQTAKESSKQALSNAQRQAKLIIQEAEAQAEKIKGKAHKDRDTFATQAEQLLGRRDEIVARLRAFLMSEVELLSRFEGGDLLGPRMLASRPESTQEKAADEPAMETAEYELADDGLEPLPELSLDTPLDTDALDTGSLDLLEPEAADDTPRASDPLASELLDETSTDDTESEWYFGEGDLHMDEADAEASRADSGDALASPEFASEEPSAAAATHTEAAEPAAETTAAPAEETPKPTADEAAFEEALSFLSEGMPEDDQEFELESDFASFAEAAAPSAQPAPEPAGALGDDDFDTRLDSALSFQFVEEDEELDDMDGEAGLSAADEPTAAAADRDAPDADGGEVPVAALPTPPDADAVSDEEPAGEAVEASPGTQPDDSDSTAEAAAAFIASFSDDDEFDLMDAVEGAAGDGEVADSAPADEPVAEEPVAAEPKPAVAEAAAPEEPASTPKKPAVPSGAGWLVQSVFSKDAMKPKGNGADEAPQSGAASEEIEKIRQILSDLE